MLRIPSCGNLMHQLMINKCARSINDCSGRSLPVNIQTLLDESKTTTNALQLATTELKVEEENTIKSFQQVMLFFQTQTSQLLMTSINQKQILLMLTTMSAEL